MKDKQHMQEIINQMQWGLDECDDWRITLRNCADEIIMLLLKEKENVTESKTLMSEAVDSLFEAMAPRVIRKMEVNHDQ